MAQQPLSFEDVHDAWVQFFKLMVRLLNFVQRYLDV